MMDQPPSPSARFYANRQSRCPDVFGTLPHPAPEQEPHPQLVPPFSHFQGFSAPASFHRYNNHSYAGCVSDESVSPRTTLPYHDHQIWEFPRQLMEQFSDGNAHIIPTGYGSTQHLVNGAVHTSQDHHGLGRVRQLSEPPMYITPPPLYYSGPENALAPAFTERPVDAIFPPRGDPTELLPFSVQRHVPESNTIRVPSYSQTSDSGQQPQHLIHAGHPLPSSGEGQPAVVSDEEDDISTAYPYESTTTASPSTASPVAHRGGMPLEEAVVEVHNTCLAATQRYLESLRVNWMLRHGLEILTHPGLAGPTRRLRDRACARGSPYSLPRRRRRALSDNSGLELMRGLRGRDRTGEGDATGVRRQEPACPVQAPTDSLLQNTSGICELVWRRACRDREDVLGAEAAGARRMCLLVECAEAVVLYDAAGWEGDPEKGFYTACRAGREFCRELGDLSGVARVESIERGEIQVQSDCGGGSVW